MTDERDPSKEAFEETGISLEDILADQDQEEPNFLDDNELKNNEKVPYFINRKLEKIEANFIEDDITLEEPLTYSRKD